MSHLIWEPVESGPLEEDYMFLATMPYLYHSALLLTLQNKPSTVCSGALGMGRWFLSSPWPLDKQISSRQTHRQKLSDKGQQRVLLPHLLGWGKQTEATPFLRTLVAVQGQMPKLKNLSITNGRVLFIQKGEWDISLTGARILAVLLTVPAKSKTL